jgi:hypothetical protein
MRAVRGADTAHMRNSSGSWLQSQKQTFYCSKGADGTTFPQVDLGAMIDSYESEAADHLTAILAHMRQTWHARTT